MIVGQIPLADAVGSYLVHSVITSSGKLRKGQLLTDELIARLRDSGHEVVTVARLEAHDVHENEAALAVAIGLAGSGIRLGKASTGRVNLHAIDDGLCEFDRSDIDRANAVDEGITIATLNPCSQVVKGRLVATVKIIPYAVQRSSLDRVLASLHGCMQVHAMRTHRAWLIQTRLPVLKEAVLDKTVQVTRQRLLAHRAMLVRESRVSHSVSAVIDALREAQQSDIDWVLIAGASAIADREDVIPAAICEAGGEVHHFGMPMDPGNLLLTGSFEGIRVIGMPGCARSPRYNGLDLVLDRLSCDLPVDTRWISSLGVGGLLHEIVDRPLPRVQLSDAPRVAALILAAGTSSRFGQRNKLLALREGRPVLEYVLDAVQSSAVDQALVVTGHESNEISDLCRTRWKKQGKPLTLVHNPVYTSGMASSLVRGFAELSAEGVDAVLVCLGDMPETGTDIMNVLVDAFVDNPGWAIYVPTFKAKRGNPVLLSASLFDSVLMLDGDTGARVLAEAFPESVHEVPCHAPGILFDIDTPGDL